MPWTGTAPNQSYSRSDGTRTGTTVWQEAEAAAVDIISTDHDAHDQDLASAINLALKKDGGNSPSANLPMGGYKHTNVADGSAPAHYASISQLINRAGISVSTVGGTGNAVTLTTGFNVTAYAFGQRFAFLIANTNSGTVTVNVDGIGAKTVKHVNGDNLSSADWYTGLLADIAYDGSNFIWINEPTEYVFGDGIIQVADRLSTPPVGPADGSYYIVTGSPTGAWATFTQHDIALYTAADTSWTPITPENGWVAYVVDEGYNYQLQSGAWVKWDNIITPSTTPLGHIHVAYVVADGTGGGAVGAANNTWYTRAFNTTTKAGSNSLSGVSLSSNTLINVPAGTYLWNATLAFGAVDNHQFRIRGTTAGIISYSKPGRNDTADGTYSGLSDMGVFTLAAADTIYLENIVSNNATATSAAGIASSFTGVSETHGNFVLIDITSKQGTVGPEGPQGTYPGVYNVETYGATGDGSTDDSVAVQAAIDAADAAGGGTVLFPPGNYLCNTDLTLNGNYIHLRGEGGPGVCNIVSTDSTGVMLTISGTRNLISNLLIYRNKFGSTDSSVVLRLYDAVQCMIDNCWLQGAYHALLIDGASCSDNTITRTSFLYATGTAQVRIVRTGAGTVGAIHFYRCLFNQDYPLNAASGTPVSTDYKGARANTTVYIAGDIVSEASYYYRCKTGGTSSGSVPALLSSPSTWYLADITDGTVVWQLMGHTEFRGLLIDTGSNYIRVDQCDFTGPYATGIDIADTAAGTDPYEIRISNCTIHGPITNAIAITHGREVYIRDCDAVNPTGTGSTYGYSLIDSEAVFISQCRATGFSFGCAITDHDASLIGNVFCGNQYGVYVSANVENFNIIGNMLGEMPNMGANSVSAITIAAGTSDYYVITGNNVRDAVAAISDGGTGTHKVVRDNVGVANRTVEPWIGLTLANGANSDIALPEGTNFYITGPSAGFSLTGLTNGTDGRTITLYNSVAQAMTLTNDATSTAANRFLTLTGADIVSTNQCTFKLTYSATASRWIQTGNQI